MRSIEDSPSKTAEASWRLYAGYRLNDYLETEISYANLGNFERKASKHSGTFTPVFLFGSIADHRCINEEFETTLLGASLLFHPARDSAFYGKLSANFWETDTVTRTWVRTGGLFSATGVVSCDGAPRQTSSESGTDFGVGAGMRFNVGDWTLRGEIERIGGIEFSPTGEAAIYTISIDAEFSSS